MNSIHSSPELPDILRYEQEVQDAIHNVPKWSDARSAQAWAHLDLMLRQFLVIIHTPRAIQAKPQHRYSMITSLESAVTLIERHIDLIDAKNFALCCIRSDYYRSALLICQIAYHAAAGSG